MTTGSLFVLSAPSGCGKTTILSHVMGSLSSLSFSVSHTTRPPRGSERDGQDYYFVSRDEFKRIRELGTDGFLEWAEVHGNFYGTSCHEVDRLAQKGSDVLLDIDVKGARQVMATEREPVTIFIVPPSLEELEKRLRSRGTDDEKNIRVRLENARWEMAQADQYEYVIMNDLLTDAIQSLSSIIIAERCRRRRTLHNIPVRYRER